MQAKVTFALIPQLHTPTLVHIGYEFAKFIANTGLQYSDKNIGPPAFTHTLWHPILKEFNMHLSHSLQVK